MLEDENARVKSAAADSLGWLGDKKAVSKLIEMLKNKYA